MDLIVIAAGLELDALRHLSGRRRLEAQWLAGLALVPGALTGASAGYVVWLGTSSWLLALVGALGCAALMLNLVRCLNAGTGYSLFDEEAALVKWSPSPWSALLLALLGAFFAQPGLMWADRAVAARVEAYRVSLREQMVEDLARPIRDHVGELRLQHSLRDADPSLATFIHLEEARIASIEQSAKERFEGEGAPSLLLLPRLEAVWSSRWFATTLTLLGALLFSMSFLMRYVFLTTVREYERYRVSAGQRTVIEHYARTREAQGRMLARFGVDALRPSPFEVPALRQRPLLLGLFRGFVVRPSGTTVIRGVDSGKR